MAFLFGVCGNFEWFFGSLYGLMLAFLALRGFAAEGSSMPSGDFSKWFWWFICGSRLFDFLLRLLLLNPGHPGEHQEAYRLDFLLWEQESTPQQLYLWQRNLQEKTPENHYLPR